MLPSPFDRLEETKLPVQDLQSGDRLFAQMDPTVGMFYLSEGLIELQRHTEAGDKITIHQARTGETFAEASLFSDQYHCDAIARATSKVLILEKRAVLKIFDCDGAFASALAARFAQQVQSYRRRIELLAIRSARERTYTAIADGMLRTNALDLAAQIGLTHETTYRALSQLVKDGRLTKIGRGKYLIKDMSK